MIDFNKPPREETEFDKLNAEYKKKFGKPYVFDFAADFMTEEETIADIRRRIAEDDPQTEPKYEPGKLY